MDALRVREATLADSDAIAVLFGELGFPSSAADLRERWGQLSAADSVLVAERDGRVIGVITLHVLSLLHRAPAWGRITALVVTASERGTGAGRALVDAAERLLRERGCGRIELTSASHLKGAHAFYERLGYVERSRRFVKERETR